jgi:hypothetical protein
MSTTYAQGPRHVPLGAKILAVLVILAGILDLIWGVVKTGVGGAGFLAGLIAFATEVRTWGGSTLWSGIVAVVSGAVEVVTGLGLLAARHWAWVLAVVVAVLSLLPPGNALLHGDGWAIFGLVVPGLVLWYLTRPHVRTAFRR